MKTGWRDREAERLYHQLERMRAERVARIARERAPQPGAHLEPGDIALFDREVARQTELISTLMAALAADYLRASRRALTAC
jgi:hypothetical protein